MEAAAAWVGLALLQGAIGYVGGQLLASAMGGPNIGDVKTWIVEAVAELENFVAAQLRQQLTELVLNQMQADLQGVIQNLNEYASLESQNQLANKFLLENCDTSTAELVPLAFEYDQAIFIATATMAYRLFALYGLYQLDQDPGHINSAKSMVDDFVTNTSAIRGRIAANLDPKVRLVIQVTEIPGRPTVVLNPHSGQEVPGTPTTWSSTIALDGTVTWNSPTSYPASQDATNVANQAWVTLASPVLQQQQDFINKVDNAIKWTAICYNAMCAKVGGTYPIPPDVAAVQDLQIPANVTMPGATIGAPTR